MANYEPLEITKIKAYIHQKYHIYLNNNKILIFDEIISTNTYLLQCANKPNNNVVICLAETQTAGRGRFEHSWFSPPNNIYLSLLWHFNFPSNQLPGLSWSIATAINNTLKKYGINDSIIKWPNDILWKDRKLAGILIEACTKPNNNSCIAVIGVGLNVNLPKPLPLDANISLTDKYNIIDVAEIIQTTPDRNQLTGMLIESLLESVIKYEHVTTIFTN